MICTFIYSELVTKIYVQLHCMFVYVCVCVYIYLHVALYSEYTVNNIYKYY